MPNMITFSETGDVFHFAVANGFVPECYHNLIHHYLDEYRVISLPPRALWKDTIVPDKLLQWDKSLAKDLADGFLEHSLENVIAVGHSFGAIATVLTAIKYPERFKAVILLDPTILPDHIMEGIDALRSSDNADMFPLANRAMKRQSTFADYQSAFDYFRQKSLFSDWSDSTLALYVKHGFIDDGDEIRLRWSPAWEAYYYKTVYTGIWQDLPNFSEKLPVLVIRGENSDTFHQEQATRFREVIPHTHYVELKDGGHLFPLSHPEETAQIISDFLRRVSN